MSKVVRVYEDPSCPVCGNEAVRSIGTRIESSGVMYHGWECQCGLYFEADPVKVPLTEKEIRTLMDERAAKGPSPDFAPVNGICYSCRRNLIEHYGPKWETKYITGCPFCHRSYCD